MLFLEGKTGSDRVQLRYGGTKRAKRQQGSEHDAMSGETVQRHGVTFRWRSMFSSTTKDKFKMNIPTPVTSRLTWKPMMNPPYPLYISQPIRSAAPLMP